MLQSRNFLNRRSAMPKHQAPRSWRMRNLMRLQSRRAPTTTLHPPCRCCLLLLPAAGCCQWWRRSLALRCAAVERRCSPLSAVVHRVISSDISAGVSHRRFIKKGCSMRWIRSHANTCCLSLVPSKTTPYLLLIIMCSILHLPLGLLPTVWGRNAAAYRAPAQGAERGRTSPHSSSRPHRARSSPTLWGGT